MFDFFKDDIDKRIQNVSSLSPDKRCDEYEDILKELPREVPRIDPDELIENTIDEIRKSKELVSSIEEDLFVPDELAESHDQGCADLDGWQDLIENIGGDIVASDPNSEWYV